MPEYRDTHESNSYNINIESLLPHSDFGSIMAFASQKEDAEKISPVTVMQVPQSESAELHIHDSLEMLFVHNGICTVRIGNKETVLYDGDVCIIAPTIPHTVFTGEKAHIVTFIFDRAEFEKHFYRVSLYNNTLSHYLANVIYGESFNSHIVIHPHSNRQIYSIFMLLVKEELNKSEFSDIIKVNLMIAAFGYLAADKSGELDISEVRLTRNEQIPILINYIHDNYRTVTLEELAKKFHYTTPYVSKLIKSVTGLNFTEVLRQIKFEICYSLLTNSNLKINRIAEIAGYQSTDHFNRVFKKSLGVTPSFYRKIRQSENPLDNRL